MQFTSKNKKQYKSCKSSINTYKEDWERKKWSNTHNVINTYTTTRITTACSETPREVKISQRKR